MVKGIQLIKRASEWSDRKAIISNNQSYTYQNLLDSSAIVATHLLGQKYDLEGVRVSFLVAPGFEYTALQWGIWRAGGIAVPLCVLHPLPSLQYVIENSHSEILIVDEQYLDLIAPIIKSQKLIICNTSDLFVKTTISTLPEIPENRRAYYNI